MAHDTRDWDAAEVQKFLEKNYNTPSPEWLEGLEKQFFALQALLEQGTNTTDDDSSKSDDEQETSPSAARAAALPVVKLVHRTFLIGCDEYLICHAIGTISQNTFEDIFWQNIDEVNNESLNSGFEVYSAGSSKFEFRFRGYHFDLSYSRWEELVRNYSSVLDAPVGFLKTREADLIYAQLVKALEIRASYKNSLSTASSPEVVRIAFYYLRAYAIERGAFCNGHLPRHDSRYFQTQQVLALVEHALQDLKENETSLTAETVVAKVFDGLLANQAFVSRHQVGLESLPERTASAMTPLSQSVLTKVRALPIGAKMNCAFFIKIDVEYNGSSSILHGKHLNMIEEQVPKLRNSILSSIQRPIHKIVPPSCMVWPGRLIQISAEPQKSSNWTYVMGWSYHTIDQLSIQQIVESWSRSIISQDEFDTTSCFVIAELCDSIEMTNVLLNSTTSSRRQTIPGPKRADLPLEAPSSPKPTKKSKQKSKQLPSSSESTTTLRTASHVISRLKHDPGSYDIDDFKVGYEDRFGGLKVKPAAEWQLDQQHKEFIPEHRIVYFEKSERGAGKDVLMWDKRTRIDLFFKSGKSAEA
ncbi:uncharacterized protein RSE6_11487 [Rhynchosporium secalis]|uniref:MJ1316 RNA cyclic group end recognition domain-containing protein n=1 Tax=Rhynchosporium secalis TaxID=38038 RepID=A0A1E1MN30_RHYSE|nr:uncharacterized protein RSE6_11487 [Rhynchosporium secalis]